MLYKNIPKPLNPIIKNKNTTYHIATQNKQKLRNTYPYI